LHSHLTARCENSQRSTGLLRLGIHFPSPWSKDRSKHHRFIRVFDGDTGSETAPGTFARMAAIPRTPLTLLLMPSKMTLVSPREDLWADAMRAERRGDGAAYERLLKDIALVLRRLVRARLAKVGLSVHEAEDVVQEILIGLHAKRHTWDDARPFLPWLFTITRYKFIDAARRLRREGLYRVDITMDELSEIFEAPAEDTDSSTPGRIIVAPNLALPPLRLAPLPGVLDRCFATPS
jgi:DNA-directed RNA polymerase specialized sigma24 family protein